MTSYTPIRRDFASQEPAMASPNKTADNLLLLPPKPEPLKNKGWADLGHPGWCLVIWTLFLALPFAYVATYVNTWVFRVVGYEKFMRNPGGLFLNKCIFLAINTILILAWTLQLNAEAVTQKHAQEEKEVKWWGEVLSILKQEQDAGRGFSEDLYQPSFPGEQ
ncbi:hypothetical protein B0J14DRAFT_695635 [Halenospora varia]|nr:hypothetical protein B0J14DRAFT_695635 [Halenospora varia]